MTDELESRLRATLGHLATRAPQAPPRFSTEVVSRSRRRRVRRNALVAGVCVVAIVAPITVMATRGTERGDVATAATTETPSRKSIEDARKRRQDYMERMRDLTPIGERLLMNNPSEDRPMSLWYSKQKSGRIVFCEEVKRRTGSGSSGCNEVADNEVATEQGTTRSFPLPVTGKVLHYGTAQAEVVRVTAVLEEGGRVTGKLQTPQGAPQAVWTVIVPADKKVTAFEFAGGEGETIKRIERPHMVEPEAYDKPVGRTVEMPGNLNVGLYERPERTLIWKLNGQAVGGMNSLTSGMAVIERGGPDGPLIDMDGKPFDVEMHEHKEHWFGITGTKTKRVALVFKDGTSVIAATRPDPWKIGGFRMFAGTQQRTDDLYAEGFKIVGYDNDGVELWHEDHKPTR